MRIVIEIDTGNWLDSIKEVIASIPKPGDSDFKSFLFLLLVTFLFFFLATYLVTYGVLDSIPAKH